MHLRHLIAAFLVAGGLFACSPFDVESQIYGCSADADCLEGFVCDLSLVPSRCVAVGMQGDVGADAPDSTDPCDLCQSGETCTNGICTCPTSIGGLICSEGQSCCADVGCLELDSNILNCGACGVACGGEESCVAGQCTCGDDAEVCQTGTSCCGGACVNPNDPACACGNVAQCEPTQRCCTGECQNVEGDPANCGGCNISCGSEQECVSAQCSCTPGTFLSVNGSCLAEGQCGADGDCPAGFGCLNSVCIQACNSTEECSDGLGCVNGYCTGGACTSADDCLVNQFCSPDGCQCNDGFADCDGAAANGCELLVEAEKCADGIDNDCNGARDCGDAACTGSSECAFTHTIFVTSRQFAGNFASAAGDLQGADDLCSSAANDVGLPSPAGTAWRAVVSGLSSTGDPIHAMDRISIQGDVLRVDGTVVLEFDSHADPNSDFWKGNFDVNDGVLLDELGTRVNNNTERAWTGTRSDGTAQEDRTCDGWTQANNNGRTGDADTSGNNWIESVNRNCGEQLRIYCISGQ